MGIKENIHYWQISLNNPEPIIDDFYFNDDIIISDRSLINKIERLRELIINYCVIIEKNKEAVSQILDEINDIIISIDNIQYTEFIAFWKSLDLSYSSFRTLDNHKNVLSTILNKYCERRRKLYDKLGYTNVIVQALYDSGSSRRKGASGIKKLIHLIQNIFGDISHIRNINEIGQSTIGYFQPDKVDKLFFNDFIKQYKIQFRFGQDHQGKYPDMILKVNDEFFIIEAKHIKESGGAQDKQILETIEFIRYYGDWDNIHYLSFVDGTYFNNFIKNNKDNKINKQIEQIEGYLKENSNNYFVNSYGLISLFMDLKGI